MRFLIVDDNHEVREAIAAFLSDVLDDEIEIAHAASAADCMAVFHAQSSDVILMDGYLGVDPACVQGPDAVRHLRAEGCTAKIVMISNAREMNRKGLAAGADAECAKVHIAANLLALLASFGMTAQ